MLLMKYKSASAPAPAAVCERANRTAMGIFGGCTGTSMATLVTLYHFMKEPAEIVDMLPVQGSR